MSNLIKNKLLNSLKIILAAILAILIAQVLHLDFAISAGIVAILSVQPTKKETLKTALSRFEAFVIALIISFICFRFLGFSTSGFFVYLAIFIIVCQFFGWYSAMAMDSVLISHFISFNAMGVVEIKNEVLLFVIGVGMGIAANLTLRKSSYIEQLKNETDDLIKQILHRMSQRILDTNLPDYDGHCFEKLDKAITRAEVLAAENYNNQFGKSDVKDREYVQMRKNQKEVLLEIFKCLVEIKTVPSTAALVSEFLEKIAVEYQHDNDVKSLLEELHSIQGLMKEKALPQNRPEFEDRALLFMILKRTEKFLNLKKDFARNYL